MASNTEIYKYKFHEIVQGKHYVVKFTLGKQLLLFTFIRDTNFKNLVDYLVLRHVIVFLESSFEYSLLKFSERFRDHIDISVNRSDLLILINHYEWHIVDVPLQRRESISENFHFILP